MSCETGTSAPATPDDVCEAVPSTVVPQGQKHIIAHRGASRESPENSTAARVAAAESGANAVEFDVVPSADGVLVVMHDDTLNRTSDCSGDIREMKWADIAGRKLEGRDPVPRLDTLRPKRLGDRKVFEEFEVDDAQAADAAAAVGRIVQKLVAFDQVVVTSDNLRALYEWKTRFPGPRIHIGCDGQDVSVSRATVNLGFDDMLMGSGDLARRVFSPAGQMRVKLVTC